jgi:hypothetical protein
MLTGQAAHVFRSAGFLRQLISKVRFEEGYAHGASGRIGDLGDHTDRLVSATLDALLPAATNVSVGYTRAFLRFDGVDFPDLGRAYVYLSSQGLSWVGGDLFLRGGEEAIFTDVVDEGPPLPNYFLSAAGSATVRPFSALRMAFTLSASRVWRRTRAEHRASLYAESAIPRLHAQLQVTRSLGLRMIGQYRIERYYRIGGALAERREQFGTDLLATYLIHPGQSVQLGWSTVADGDLDLPLATRARGGIAKIAYLWRL